MCLNTLPSTAVIGKYIKRRIAHVLHIFLILNLNIFVQRFKTGYLLTIYIQRIKKERTEKRKIY